MTDQQFTSYQYSIIRYFHDAETQEFLNIGVALFAPEFNYFRTDITPLFRRISDTFFNANTDQYRSYVYRLLRRFDRLSREIEKNEVDMFEPQHVDIEPLMRKYIRRDSSFQYSIPASGISPATYRDLDDTFDHLFATYVEKYIKKREKETRDESVVWRKVYRPKIEKIDSNILDNLKPVTIQTPVDALEYELSWKNGKWHLILPISFDLLLPASLTNKAYRTLGRNVQLNGSREISRLYMLIGEPLNKDKNVMRSYSKSIDILTSNGVDYNYDRMLIFEDAAGDFASYLHSEMQQIE